MRNSKSIRLFDASGGLNTFSPATALEINESSDLQNINLVGSAGHCGFESRRGNTVFNSSAMDSGAVIHGMGYYRQSDADEWLMAICGTKIFKSEFDGTMDDITGAVTITTGQNNIWTHFVMNDLSIWFGGNLAADVPIKWNGAGNAAALGGTPPVAEFGLTANNRAFVGNTVANPSTVYWSILGNPEDWSGTGSGNQDVSKNDGDTLVFGAQIAHDHLLLFKQNSIHDLIIRTSPFPLFEVRRGFNLGAVSKRGWVLVDNLIYYITPEPRMKATDGKEIINFPDKINDVWDGLNKSRLKYIKGVYYPKLRQIHWLCSSGSATTHDLTIIWDLERKCWLRHPTGFKMNDAVIAQDRILYTGSYAGKIYKQDVSSTFTDASESSPGAISAFWRSGWIDMESLLQSKIVPYAKLSFQQQSSGTFDFGYGYDFSPDKAIIPISMSGTGAKYGLSQYGVAKYGGVSDKTSLQFLKGRGAYFQYLVRHTGVMEGLFFNGMEIPVKPASVSIIR